MNASRERWQRIWQEAGAVGDPGPCCERLITAYSAPDRHYHNLDHISECLGELDAARHLAADPVAVELALWFHDAVYDSRATANEERSADLARPWLLRRWWKRSSA